MRTIRLRAGLAEVAALACAIAVFVASALEPFTQMPSAAVPATAAAR